MRLSAYLELKDLSLAEFAVKIGSTSATVSRVIAGTQNIPLSLQDAIIRETDGAVDANDLHAAYAEARAAG